LFNYKRLLLSIIILATIIWFPLESHSSGNKIAVEIKEDLRAGHEEVELLIYLTEQADTGEVAAKAVKDMPGVASFNDEKEKVRFKVAESLQELADESQEDLVSFLETKKGAGKVSELERFYIVNMIYARVSASLVEEIAGRPEVKHIYPNREIKLEDPPGPEKIFDAASDEGLEWNLEQVGAPAVWNEYGYQGSGVVIGIIDTGVDLEHPALQDGWRGYDPDDPVADYNWFDPVHERSDPDDRHGHGTKVLGVALGKDPSAEKPVGVAPEAEWIAARGFSDQGGGRKNNFLKAGEFMLSPTDLDGENPDPGQAPDVVICSWGSDTGEDDWFREMVENWRNAYIFPVFAAGNSGPGDETIHNPANYPESFAVGATDQDKALASFSSRGPGPYDDDVKPEMVAPGKDIYTTFKGGGYGYDSGTSFAAPHVAGVAALILSTGEKINVDEMAAVLKESAQPLKSDRYPDHPNYGFGYGMLDALEAVQKVTGVYPGAYRSVLYWQHEDYGVKAWQMRKKEKVEKVIIDEDIAQGWRIKAVYDLNDNGFADLIWQHEEKGELKVWYMEKLKLKERGYILNPATGENKVEPAWEIKAVYDMDGDGNPDIIWQAIEGKHEGEIALWLMDDLTVEKTGRVTHANGRVRVDPSWQIRSVYDFFADGTPEILWQAIGDEHEGQLAYWMLDQFERVDGGRFSRKDSQIDIDPAWQMKTVLDLLGDGKPEIVWQNLDGRISYWKMDGTKRIGGGLLVPGQVDEPGWNLVGSSK